LTETVISCQYAIPAKVFLIPPSKIYHEIDKLTGCMAPVVKIPNFDQGFYNPSLVLNEILGQSKFLCSGAAQQIGAARDNGSLELPSSQYIK